VNLRNHPGWTGLFTQERADGALPNNTRVRKINSEPGDTHKDGAEALVLGSIGHPEIGIGYFVEWETHPTHAVFVAAARIEEVID
jgi:hypothetical protein